MNAIITTRTPELIAAEINDIKTKTKNMVLYNSIEIGRRLIEAKEILEHGQWGGWLETSVDYSQRTAINLMKIFTEYGATQISLLGDNVKSQTFANLSYSQAISLLGIPTDERETFVKDNHAEEKSTRELHQLVKEKQELEERAKAAEARAEKENRLHESVSKAYDNLEKTNEENMAKVKKYIVEIETLKNDKDKLQEAIENAQNAGDNKEADRLRNELQEAENKLHDLASENQDLEQKLKEKPVEIVAAPEVIEKIPENIEKELAELRAMANSKESPETMKFKVHFDTLVGNFNDLLTALAKINEKDPALYEKYKNATYKLISSMSSQVK